MFHGHVSLQEGTGWLFLLYLGPFLPPSWHRSWSTTVLAAPSGHRRSPLLDVGPWGGKMEATQMPRGLGWEINIQTYLYTVVIYISNWMQNMQKDIHMPIIAYHQSVMHMLWRYEGVVPSWYSPSSWHAWKYQHELFTKICVHRSPSGCISPEMLQDCWEVFKVMDVTKSSF